MGVVGCFLTVANSRSQSSQSLKDEIALLRKELVALHSQRSRSPQGQRAQKHPLALKDKPTPKRKGGGGAKGNNNSKGGKAKAHDNSSHPRQDGPHNFDRIQKRHKGALWHPRANGNPKICWKFQRIAVRRSRKVHTYASVVHVQESLTLTVCVSKPRTDPLPLLNVVTNAPLPLLLQ